MKTDRYTVLGVMSGTSLDGVDLALINFVFDGRWTYSINCADTLPYTSEWQERLRLGIHLGSEDLEVLDREYTRLLGGVIRDFIAKNEVGALDAVCSHGHTIKHEPQNGVTLQIGNREELALLTGQTVVCDFRVADVALGGQGAPLVPIGDRLLFGEFDACLNLGGFANISQEVSGERTAYDICAVNTVLNRYAEKLGMPFDEGGRIAAASSIHDPLLEALNALPFYQLQAPKSLGLEWVLEVVLPLINSFELTPQQVLATYTAHIGKVIGQAMPQAGKVLVTGGGTFNEYLINIAGQYSGAKIVVPGPEVIDNKEALIFGLLGVLRLRNEVNCLSSVTGASRDHSSGDIFFKPNGIL